MGSRFMTGTVTALLILLLSLILWVLYYMTFKDQPESGVTTIIVGFSALCVFVVKATIDRAHKK
jgi:hypothetical protein